MNKNKVGLSVAIAIALLAGGARAQTEPATAAAPAGAPPAGRRPPRLRWPRPPPRVFRRARCLRRWRQRRRAARRLRSRPTRMPRAGKPSSTVCRDERNVDTTQSYGPASNNVLLARPGSYEGSHPRSLTVNNSLAGVRLVAPDVHAGNSNIHTTRGQIRSISGAQPTMRSRRSSSPTPALRLRLFYVRLETPAVDVLVGQYHDLFAWGGAGFYPHSVAFLGHRGRGLPPQPQIRLWKTVDPARA